MCGQGGGEAGGEAGLVVPGGAARGHGLTGGPAVPPPRRTGAFLQGVFAQSEGLQQHRESSEVWRRWAGDH